MLQNSILARIWRLAKVLPAALLVVATMTGSSVAANLVVEGQSVDYAPSPEGAPVALFHVEQKGYRNGYKLDCARRQFLWTSNVELASGQATANTAGAQWRPVTGDSKIARAVFMAICGDLGVTGTLDEVFPTNDFAATLDGTKCTDRCKVAVNGWAVELARVAIDDQGTPAYTLWHALRCPADTNQWVSRPPRSHARQFGVDECEVRVGWQAVFGGEALTRAAAGHGGRGSRSGHESWRGPYRCTNARKEH